MSERQRDSIFSPFFLNFTFLFFFHEGSRRGVRDREKQRQYFTGAAQSSSADTQYLQPTAMQQRICVCVCVCVRAFMCQCV